MIVTPEGHAVPQADRIVVTRKATDGAHDGLVDRRRRYFAPDTVAQERTP